jgi:hypothetical protein
MLLSDVTKMVPGVDVGFTWSKDSPKAWLLMIFNMLRALADSEELSLSWIIMSDNSVKTQEISVVWFEYLQEFHRDAGMRRDKYLFPLGAVLLHPCSAALWRVQRPQIIYHVG